MNDQALAPQPRPKFAQWMFERRLTPTDVAKAIGCSREHIRLITLPFGEEGPPRKPSQKLRQKIAAYTRGEVGLDAWEPPKIVTRETISDAPRGEAVAS